MLSTIHQRSLRELFQKEKSLSLETLKERFVDTNTMNQTTLYRILERWKQDHMIYEIKVGKKRVFLFCEHAHTHEGIKISYCQNCECIDETHFPIPPNTAKAEMIEYLTCCEQCGSSSDR